MCRASIFPTLSLSLLLAASMTVLGCDKSDPFDDLKGDETDTKKDGSKGKDDKKGGGDGDDTTKGSDKKTGEGGDKGKDDKKSGGGGDNTGGGDMGTGTGDKGGGSGKKKCAPKPARYIVLGDETALGRTPGLDGPEDDRGGFRMMYNHLVKEYGFSGLEYENYAKAATKTEDVPKKQTDGVVPTGKSGHVLVNINVGGKDLVDFAAKSDDVAKQAFVDKEPLVEGAWKDIFKFFNDKDKFPDGATIIVNNVFNPMDDCVNTHSPHFVLLLIHMGLSDVKTKLLGKFNQKLKDMADMEDNRFLANHHVAFRGHAHLYDNKECPHYMPDAEYWLVEQKTDINIEGQAAFGKTLKDLAKKMYKDCE